MAIVRFFAGASGSVSIALLYLLASSETYFDAGGGRALVWTLNA